MMRLCLFSFCSLEVFSLREFKNLRMVIVGEEIEAFVAG